MKSKVFVLWTLCVFCLAMSATAQSRFRGVTLAADVTEQDINDLGAWKANVARYQLVWDPGADTANEEQYAAWLESALARLDGLLPAFQRNRIKLVLDLHTPPGGFVSRTPSWHRVFKEQWAQRVIVESWQRIATRYKDSDTIWGYDILNEPAQNRVSPGLKNWSALAQEIGAAIRKIDKKHPIIVEPIYGDQAKLGALRPLKVKNVIYSAHMYYPLKFHHQGLYGKPMGVSYPKGKFNRQALRKNLQRLMTFQRKNKAKIYIGEFTAVRWAPKKSSVSYLRDVINIFESQKWHWTYHAFREADPWSVEHSGERSDLQKTATPTDRELLLRKYFARNR